MGCLGFRVFCGLVWHNFVSLVFGGLGVCNYGRVGVCV